MFYRKPRWFKRTIVVAATMLLGVTMFISMMGPQLAKGDDALIHERRETDSVGREWLLKEWKEGTRPYPKNLREREIRYNSKWGENWFGVRNGRRIHNPGNWQWETVVTLPPDLAAKIVSKKPMHGRYRIWGDRFWGMCFVWAPGGEAVTDIYALADRGIFHYDPISKVSSFIGSPTEGGLKDGYRDQARMELSFGTAMTLDPTTGRLYFIQKSSWRYVEKLLAYECTKTKKVCYLPAVLDWHDMYRKVKSPYGGDLKPVFREGKRLEPIFVVRTNTSLKTLYIPGSRTGRRPLITPDGKGAYFSQVKAYGNDWDTLTLFDHTALFDIETGEMLGKLKLNGVVPPNGWNGTRRWDDGPGTAGGNVLGHDGRIYTSQHGGSGGGPGRMFSIDPSTGAVTMLYDSMADDGTWQKRKSPVIDGPADAASLDFTSTLWQTQCPRTGAIINGGWDNSGIRRYHDGFVTSIVNGDQDGKPPRPGWVNPPWFAHGNSSPSIAPNGDLYIADDNFNVPRIFRIYRTDWPKEQPVNGYAEKFLPKEKMEELMLDYAKRYIGNYEENNRLLKGER